MGYILPKSMKNESKKTIWLKSVFFKNFPLSLHVKMQEYQHLTNISELKNKNNIGKFPFINIEDVGA